MNQKQWIGIIIVLIGLILLFSLNFSKLVLLVVSLTCIVIGLIISVIFMFPIKK